jgi:hypothetical protein
MKKLISENNQPPMHPKKKQEKTIKGLVVLLLLPQAGT